MTDPSTPDLRPDFTTPLAPDEVFVMEESPYDGTRLVATKDREDAENWHTTPRDGAYAAVDSRASVRLLAPSSPGAREGEVSEAEFLRAGKAEVAEIQRLTKLLCLLPGTKQTDPSVVEYIVGKVFEFAAAPSVAMLAAQSDPGGLPDFRELVAGKLFERDYPGFAYSAVDRAIYLSLADDFIAKGSAAASPASPGAPAVVPRLVDVAAGDRITQVCVMGREVIVLGDPDAQGDHHCDSMGCGQSHVLARQSFAEFSFAPSPSPGATPVGEREPLSEADELRNELGAAKATLDRMTTDALAWSGYIHEFCKRLGVRGLEGGANVAEVALCKLDALLRAAPASSGPAVTEEMVSRAVECERASYSHEARNKNDLDNPRVLEAARNWYRIVLTAALGGEK